VRLKKSKCADSTEVSANMRPKFTGLTDRTVIETLLEDEGSALSPDVSAIASPAAPGWGNSDAAQAWLGRPR
jgi:hypothetical protein